MACGVFKTCNLTGRASQRPSASLGPGLSFNVERQLLRLSIDRCWPGLPVRGQARQWSLVMRRIEGPVSTTMTIASRPNAAVGSEFRYSRLQVT